MDSLFCLLFKWKVICLYLLSVYNGRIYFDFVAEGFLVVWISMSAMTLVTTMLVLRLYHTSPTEHKVPAIVSRTVIIGGGTALITEEYLIGIIFNQSQNQRSTICQQLEDFHVNSFECVNADFLIGFPSFRGLSQFSWAVAEIEPSVFRSFGVPNGISNLIDPPSVICFDNRVEVRVLFP